MNPVMQRSDIKQMITKLNTISSEHFGHLLSNPNTNTESLDIVELIDDAISTLTQATHALTKLNGGK